MSAAANLQPPEALKQLKPYLTLATQLDQRDEKIVAYYCRLYSVQTGMQINRSLPECKKFLAHLMDILENVCLSIRFINFIYTNLFIDFFVFRLRNNMLVKRR